jgi:hypothetical protein
MPDQEMGSESRPPSQEAIEKHVEDRVIQARKEDILEIYEDLLKTIWNRIQPTLGRVTVMAIMERAVVLTKERYLLIEHLRVIPEGVDFHPLHQRVGEEDRDVIREALKELIANLIDILAMLTGDILVRQLMQEIERREV